MMADLKSVVGGELKGYTELLAEGREEAIYRMQSDAHALGANAILGVRLASSSPTPDAVEIIAYGTAVKIQKIFRMINDDSLIIGGIITFVVIIGFIFIRNRERKEEKFQKRKW